MSRHAAGWLALFALAAGSATAAAAPRAAIVLGNDLGHSGEARLRYAERDARRIADVLTSVGDLAPGDVSLLVGRTADDARAAIRAAEERLARLGDDTLLLVYYSGHADADALHLGGTDLPLGELHAMFRDSRVPTRVLVIDACRSGALTHVKGGRPGGPFALRAEAGPNPHGVAIITSSAAGEDSQESDELQSSFFTHHLISGLLGAADENGDGAVTLAEAFTYAARHTVGSTATTWAGPQHPTYWFDLGGRDYLVLTRPKAAAAGAQARLGHLAFADPGSYLVRREGDADLTLELESDAARRPIALPAGRYEVIRRGGNQLMTGTFTVAAAESTSVTSAQMRRTDFGRAVRKGGTARVHAVGLYANGGVRGDLLGLGKTLGGGVGARVDLPALSLNAAFDMGSGSIDGVRGTRLTTRELGLRVGAFRAFDASRITIAIGAELGVSRFDQTASEQSLAGSTYAANAGPALSLEVPLGRRYFLWAQTTLPVYLVQVENEDRTSQSLSVRPTYRFSLAVGGYL